MRVVLDKLGEARGSQDGYPGLSGILRTPLIAHAAELVGPPIMNPKFPLNYFSSAIRRLTAEAEPVVKHFFLNFQEAYPVRQHANGLNIKRKRNYLLKGDDATFQ